jgi:hypothetical protein
MKTTAMRITIGALAVSFFVFILLLSSCKDNDKDQAHVNVRMTDAPAAYDAVYIDVQGVEITGAGGGTVVLSSNPGIYNLLELSNGTDTLIAAGGIDAGQVEQIRLILGTNNTIVVDGVTHPLTTPSAQQSGLKLQVNRTFEPGVEYGILLDFDANKSIVMQGNGDYSLKPVIRTVDVALNGSIRGSIAPVSALVVVEASNGTDTFTSITNANGEFLISGLVAGTYSVTLTPPSPLLPVTVNNVVVTAGSSTNIGVITF